MAIFPTLELEAIVQIDDKTRLDASKTFASKDGPAITKVEIEPEAGNGFVDVTATKAADWFTDWKYSSAGTKTVTLQINGDTTPVTKTFSIVVISEADDYLFSSDADLTQDEPDILRYVKPGRATFKDVHREAQKEILDLLDRKGYRTIDGSKITADLALDKSEVRTMAKYLALHLIYNGQSNQIGDIHRQKSDFYWSKYLVARDRQIVGFDMNLDGELAPGEGVVINTAKLVRR